MPKEALLASVKQTFCALMHSFCALRKWLKVNTGAGVGRSCPGIALFVPILVLAAVKQDTLTAAVKNLNRGRVDDLIGHIARLLKSTEEYLDINQKMMVSQIPATNNTLQ
jgi:hypothetical protein